MNRRVARQQSGLDTAGFIILFVGRLVPIKDMEILLGTMYPSPST
jgi:hypothetical protein